MQIELTSCDIRPNRPNRPIRPNTPDRPNSPAITGRELLSGNGNQDAEMEAFDQRKRELRTGKHCESNGLVGQEFNKVIRKFTAFSNTELSRSLLNDTDTGLVAACSANWYIVTTGGIPSVTCDQFDAQDCANNQDLPFTKDQVRCLEPSAMPSATPSVKPSSQPSSQPSSHPSSEPSTRPSYQPSESSMPSRSSTPSLTSTKPVVPTH